MRIFLMQAKAKSTKERKKHVKTYPNLKSIITPDEFIVNIDDNIHKTLAMVEEMKNTTRNVVFALANYLKANKQYNQYNAVMNCGNFLMFKQYQNFEQTTKLDKANFCRHPLCPMCEHRKSLIEFNKLSLAAEEVKTKGRLYHLVLAIPNTYNISKAELMNLKAKGVYFIKHHLNIKDYFSSLEVKYTKDRGFHPHLHILLKSDKFINVDEEYIKKMSFLWKQVYFKEEDGYDGYTYYIRGLTSDEGLHELTKYVVKGDTFDDIIDAIKKGLPKAIKGVRKYSAGGDFKKALTNAKGKLTDELINESESLKNTSYYYRVFEYITGKKGGKYVER